MRKYNQPKNFIEFFNAGMARNFIDIAEPVNLSYCVKKEINLNLGGR